jgi:hypothetical protein
MQALVAPAGMGFPVEQSTNHQSPLVEGALQM